MSREDLIDEAVRRQTGWLWATTVRVRQGQDIDAAASDVLWRCGWYLREVRDEFNRMQEQIARGNYGAWQSIWARRNLLVVDGGRVNIPHELWRRAYE